MTTETTQPPGVERKAAQVDEYQRRAFELLRAFARQRPGLDPGSYAGAAEAFRADNNLITQALRDFNRLYSAARWRSWQPDQIREAFRRAFSGRITLHESDGLPQRLSYCIGQYWPTEYRSAACAVLAAMLWDYTREGNPDYDAHQLRAHFRSEFGRGIAGRYFQ